MNVSVLVTGLKLANFSDVMNMATALNDILIACYFSDIFITVYQTIFISISFHFISNMS